MTPTGNPDQSAPLTFAASQPSAPKAPAGEPWRVLVVDDERDVHEMTRLVLSGFSFENRSMDLLHAYSASEAREMLSGNRDIALILLDVVMEEDDAGLQLVRFIRETIENEIVRIILRTGQPGQAPEQSVIVGYDINDYKEKVELTAQKLITSIISALRAYKTIRTVAQLNEHLEAKVEERTAQLRLLNQELEQSLRKLEEDEAAGRRIQTRMLPAAAQTYCGVVFRRMLVPSLHLSGDFVDYFPIDARRTGFYLADVSGHGVASAFVTVLLKSFISHHCSLFKTAGDDTILHPASLIEKLNEELLRENLGKHMTIFYGVLDAQTGVIDYVNGGHFPYPLLALPGRAQELLEKSPAVGLFDQAEYTSSRVALPLGAQLVIFSDGMLEILPETELVQKTQALARLLEAGPLDLEWLAREYKLEDGASLPDDVTALTVTRESLGTDTKPEAYI